MTPPPAHTTTLRVRYCETDAMGYLHHANYFNLFEIARTELFRSMGGDYRGMEARGFFLVVVQVGCDYKSPARYDDLLDIRATLAKESPAKLEHHYEVLCGARLVARGRSVLACVDREGRVQRITPEVLYGAAGGPAVESP